MAFARIISSDSFWLQDGIETGEMDYTGLIGKLQDDFFPWKNPEFPLGDVAFWIVAIMGAVVSSAVFMPKLAGAALGAVVSFAGAGVQQASYSLQPE